MKTLSAPIGILTADLLLSKPERTTAQRTAILGSVKWKMMCNLSSDTAQGRGGNARRRRLALKA